MSQKSKTSDTLFLLDSSEDMRQHISQLLEQGKQKVFLFSRCLNSLLFNYADIADSISRIARASRYSEICILVEQPSVIVENNHLLLNLYRRLPSKIQCRKITIKPEYDYEFMVVDDDKLWLQHKPETYTGFTDYNNRQEVKRLKGLFQHLWKFSEEDSNLRATHL